VQPKTYATFNLRQSKYEYTDPASTLDSTDTYMLVGVRWEATAATTGRFAFGRERKKFDSVGTAAGRQDFSGVSWEGGVNWKPLTYSSVDYNTYRRTYDSTGLGDYTVDQTHQLVWTHAWSSRVTSSLTGLYTDSQFTNAPVATAGGASREDKSKSVGLRVTYNMRRWLNIGADYTYSTRDSNDFNFNYNRNQYMLYFAATL
jgi:polysaccharide biosynthesis protein VpsM